MNDEQSESMSNPPTVAPDDWLPKMLLEETSLGLRTVWDLYLKFYTVFLTVNFITLGLVVQHTSLAQRWPIVLAFVVQNVISAGTALCIANFSRTSTGRYGKLCRHLAEHYRYDKVVVEAAMAPAPSWLGRWGGIANALSHVALVICWLATLWV